MAQMRDLLGLLTADRDGTAVIEYAMIFGLMVLGIMSAMHPEAVAAVV